MSQEAVKLIKNRKKPIFVKKNPKKCKKILFTFEVVD